MNWYIGQKVVCVDDKPRVHPTSSVKRGCIYTIAAITDDDLGLILIEVRSPWAMDGSYWSDRFRPFSELDLSEELARVEVQRQPLEEREIIREPQRA